MLKLGHISGHTFFQANLKPGSLVVDLGVNHGQFSRGCIARFKARVFGVEPDPRAYADARQYLGDNLLNAAISADDEPIWFYLSDYDQCSSIYEPQRNVVEEVQVQGIGLQRLLERIGCERVALLKVDIEGAEYPLLLATQPDVLRQCDQISVEFHSPAEWPIQESFGRVCERLNEIGFEEFDFSEDIWMHDVLFVNRSVWKIGLLQKRFLIPLLKMLGRERRRFLQWF